MIKNPYQNFKPQAGQSGPAVPAGNYVAKILKAEQMDGFRPRLAIYVDVTEGEFAGAWMKRFNDDKASGRYTPKYRGIYYVNLPAEDDRYPASTQRNLERLADALQRSNDGYTWDWDEGRLRGLLIGIRVRDEEYMMERDGEIISGTAPRIFDVAGIQDVRQGLLPVGKPKALSDEKKAKILGSTGGANTSMTAADDVDLPF